MDILFEDEDVIVIHKEAGIATQTANIREKDCVSLIKEHLCKSAKKSEDLYVGVIHRLDQPVEGLLVFAKNQRSAGILSKSVTTDMMSKRYRAVVEGKIDVNNPAEADGVTVLGENRYELRNYLCKDAANKVAIVVGGHGKECTDKKAKEAVLEFSVIGYDSTNDTSELCIDLKTGRFHQIRCQLANLGHPIAGDRKYGAKMPYQSRKIGLIATELVFVHPKSNKKMEYRLSD